MDCIKYLVTLLVVEFFHWSFKKVDEELIEHRVVLDCSKELHQNRNGCKDKGQVREVEVLVTLQSEVENN